MLQPIDPAQYGVGGVGAALSGATAHASPASEGGAGGEGVFKVDSGRIERSLDAAQRTPGPRRVLRWTHILPGFRPSACIHWATGLGKQPGWQQLHLGV